MTEHPLIRNILEAHGAPQAKPEQKARAWRSGPWIVLHVQSGGAAATASLTPNEVAILAEQLFPGLMAEIDGIFERYAMDPDATDDQVEHARGINLDIEQLFTEKSA
jgi:hypothetical protein